MAILKILKEQDRGLRLKSRPVNEITPRILQLLEDMAETMRRAEGCGLAAPQVGVLRRVVVIETEPGNLLELINPVIIEQSGEQYGQEGCLSLPGKAGIVKRPAEVSIEALNRNGECCRYTGTELLARAFCHEIDHLDGILYTDKVIRMIGENEAVEE